MVIKITIKCLNDGTTQINYPSQEQYGRFRYQAKRSTIITQLIREAHYNDVFSVTPILTEDSEHERTLAEVKAFKKALQKDFSSVPDLNLSIESEATPEKVARKAATDEEQLAILKEAVLVAEKIRYYPRTVPLSVLNAPPSQFSAQSLLKAKKTVEEAHGFIKSDFAGEYHFASASKLKNALIFFTAYKNTDFPIPLISFLAFIVGLATLFSALLIPPLLPLLGVAIPALIIAVGGLIIPPLFKKHFNAKTGCDEMGEKLRKISPGFLKSLEKNKAPDPTLSIPSESLIKQPILGYTPTTEILKNLESTPDSDPAKIRLKTPKK